MAANVYNVKTGLVVVPLDYRCCHKTGLLLSNEYNHSYEDPKSTLYSIHILILSVADLTAVTRT